MCRWLAYTGSPIVLSEVLYTPVHSLIDQSLHSRMGAETTNGDGFGIGWYHEREKPGRFRNTEPAWNDANLREISDHIKSRLFFAHIRAAVGSPVQQTNCHPFRHENWLWMHNGFVDGVADYKRDLAFAVAPGLYSQIAGTTDSELMFYLALTFGLRENPTQAIAKAVGFVEEEGRKAGVQFPFQGTIATTDGTTIWAVRYSSVGKSRTLFVNRDVPELKKQFPGKRYALLQGASDDARLVVSEPVGDLPGAWIEVPESTCVEVSAGREMFHDFRPQAVTVDAANLSTTSSSDRRTR